MSFRTARDADEQDDRTRESGSVKNKFRQSLILQPKAWASFGMSCESLGGGSLGVDFAFLGS